MEKKKRLLQLIRECAGYIDTNEQVAAMDTLSDMLGVLGEDPDELVVVSERVGDVFNKNDLPTRCEHGFSSFEDCPTCILEADIPR